MAPSYTDAAVRQAFTDSNLKQQSQSMMLIELITIGNRLMKIQKVLSFALSRSSFGSGRAAPISKHTMMPQMTPKFIEKPKVELCSAGTVSFM